MTHDEVVELLKANRNERGEDHWQRMPESQRLSSFGIGLTQLRKLAKTIGRDHELALELWQSDIYDARVIGALIDEPKKMTRSQAESQVEQLELGMLAHVYCSCGATLAKSPIAQELATDWMDSPDELRRRAGFLLLSELAKKKSKTLDDAYFERYVDRIEEQIGGEENFVRGAMAGALFCIGKRNADLHEMALSAARTIGPVEVDYGNSSCEPFDIVKNLTSDYVLTKFGKKRPPVQVPDTTRDSSR